MCRRLELLSWISLRTKVTRATLCVKCTSSKLNWYWWSPILICILSGEKLESDTAPTLNNSGTTEPLQWEFLAIEGTKKTFPGDFDLCLIDVCANICPSTSPINISNEAKGSGFAFREKLQKQTSLFAISSLTVRLFPLKICLSQISLVEGTDTFVILGRACDGKRCRRQIFQWEQVQVLQKSVFFLFFICETRRIRSCVEEKAANLIRQKSVARRNC